MTHEYTAEVIWQRTEGETFTHNRYSRRHVLRFDGGVEVPGSSAVSSVPLPWSDPQAIDPEEMLVASISSCHMLWFLSLAAKERFAVASYHDRAVGVMTKNERGKLWVSAVTLQPAVTFDGERRPTTEQIDALHHRAHDECFIANSLKTEVRVEQAADG